MCVLDVRLPSMLPCVRVCMVCIYKMYMVFLYSYYTAVTGWGGPHNIHGMYVELFGLSLHAWVMLESSTPPPHPAEAESGTQTLSPQPPNPESTRSSSPKPSTSKSRNLNSNQSFERFVGPGGGDEEGDDEPSTQETGMGFPRVGG